MIETKMLRNVALAVACALAITGLTSLPLFERFHNLDIDVLHFLRHAIPDTGQNEADSATVIVALDEITYATQPFAGLPKVMWTPQIASVQDSILTGGARVIGWDFILPTSAATYVADKNIDRELLKSLARAKQDGRIVLGTAQVGETLIRPHRLFSWAAGGARNMRSVNVNPDAGGIVRRIPTFFQTKKADGIVSFVPSMALELAARKLGSQPVRQANGQLSLGGDSRHGIANDAVILNFSTASGSIPTFSFADLYHCGEEGKSAFFRKHFAEKVVLFGLVLDIEDRKLSSNRFITEGGPVGPVLDCMQGNPSKPSKHAVRSTTSGVYLHAIAVNNILRGDGLEVLAPRMRALFSLPLALVTGLATISLGLPGAILSCLLAAGAWAISAVLIFDQSLILPLLLPLMAGFLTFVLVLGLRFVFLDKDARFLRKAFSSYVAPALVDQLIKQPDKLKLGGERREMTFLFTDLAGFTSLIEQQDPEEAVQLLNAYLDQMVQIAKRHGGTIDKVVGDALHVIFSAPLDQSDHAKRAVDCALEMDVFASGFAMEQQSNGIPFGHTRIGVNSGPAIIGNFGGNEFFDYTAHGDAVNTAARLESVNKQFGTLLAVSGETVRCCPDFSGRLIGHLILKGKTQATEVYEPICNEAEQSELFAKYASAFELLEREEAGAKAAFSALAKEFPDDGVTQFHLSRLNSSQTGAIIELQSK
ncbi:MAG: adenylate/guanylate cyclase domain-containing protein [Gammaproteobacteria bacterium]